MLEKTFNPHQCETRIYKAWEKAEAFKPRLGAEKGSYVLMMPPPNVTGSLHIGHALNCTLQDILIRYHRMQGYEVLWQPGMDHAGISTQVVVENQLNQEGSDRRTLGREKFLERVWHWKEEKGGIILEQQRRLGISPDWSRERFTLDEGLNHAVRKVFVDLYHQGLIYRAQRLVNWDPHLLTVLSDLEVMNLETQGTLTYLHYPVEGEENLFIPLATTRPETLFGDQAVAVHPQDDRYAHLIGRFVILPLVGRRIPILADAHCDPEIGTGAVKITPAHDFKDFDLSLRHSLTPLNIFDERGGLNEAVPQEYQGLDRFIARQKVVQDLKEKGFFLKTENISHIVPYGQKSGVVLEPRLTDQWFVNAQALAGPALDAVRSGKTKILPSPQEKIYFNWLEEIQPWCISRQLWWGHRIPAWYGPDGRVFVDMSEEGALKQAADFYGKSVTLSQDEDVLDTWFSSALWPFSTLGWPEKTQDLEKYYPSTVLVTGVDILFFWVARMMMMGLHFMGDVPFKTILMHALVRDEKGKKMSKSKGNVIDPLDLMKVYGADALRFTMASLAAPGRSVNFSISVLEGYRNFATKVWNAARFCEHYQCLYDPEFEPSSVKEEINQWMLSELISLEHQVRHALDSYRLDDAATYLYQFIWGLYCDWYLELAKPVLDGTQGADPRETKQTCAWVLGQICKLLHPLMPFLTEELWHFLTKGTEGLLILASWPSFKISWTSEASSPVPWWIRLISEIRSIRREINVPAKALLKLGLFGAPQTQQQSLKAGLPFIQRLARLEEIILDVQENDPRFVIGRVQFVLDDTTIFLSLGQVVDLEREKQRLAKNLQEVTAALDILETQLKNQAYVSKAPEAILAKNRQRQKELALSKQKIEQASHRICS